MIDAIKYAIFYMFHFQFILTQPGNPIDGHSHLCLNKWNLVNM